MRKTSFALSNAAIHLAVCGGAIIILASSGWLLVLSTEARNKTVLIPLLLLTAASYWLYRRQRDRCETPKGRTVGNKVAKYGLSVLWVILLTFVLVTYVVIPLWLPGYTGQGLLPGGGGPILPGV